MARKASLSERRAARKAYEQARRTSRPGEGKRFRALVESARASGAENPEALAAAVGIKKYGKQRMAKWAAAARKRKKG